MFTSARQHLRKWSLNYSLQQQTHNNLASRGRTLSTCKTPGMPASHIGDETTASNSSSHASVAQHIQMAMSNGGGGDETGMLSEQCAKVNRRVYEFLERKPTSERVGQVQRMTRESLGVIGEALKRYSLDELSFSYNGGKDCLVLLILYLTALHTHSVQTATTLPSLLRSVYIVSPNPFPAVTSFVHSSARKYHLSLSQYHKPMREAFASYLEDYPQVRAIFVGTRRTDPHGGKLTHFDETDGGWPRFMRIHPVIDWHYTDIWGFIKELNVDYCELYDMGYTSLGGTDDTHPNPALKDGQGRYRPAFELIEDEEERLGRDR